MDQNLRDGKCGWRVGEWGPAVGLCRASVYNLIAARKITHVKSGRATIIITPPRDYLAGLVDEAR